MLRTSWDVEGNVMTLTVEEGEGKRGAFVSFTPPRTFTRQIDLDELLGGLYSQLGPVGQGICEFGAFTALRNATAAAADLAEAEEKIDAKLAAWASGEYGSARIGSAVPFRADHILCRAVEAVSQGQQSAAAAAARLSELAEESAQKSFHTSFAALEQKDRDAIRRAIVKKVLDSKPAIALKVMDLEREEKAAREARRREYLQQRATASTEDITI